MVQPGVEFDHHHVIDFEPERAPSSPRLIESQPHMVYEAHSTDYQTPENLRALVQRHFAILKVGPGLDVRAARGALGARSDRARVARVAGGYSQLRPTVCAAMSADPKFWNKYYTSTGHQLELDWQYSLSDRIRYYWPVPAVDAALDRLLANLEAKPPPLTLLSQYMPAQYEAVRAGELSRSARELVLHHVNRVPQQYFAACGMPDELDDEISATRRGLARASRRTLDRARNRAAAGNARSNPGRYVAEPGSGDRCVSARRCWRGGICASFSPGRAARRSSANAWRRCCMRHLNRRVEAIPTTDLLSGPAQYFQADVPTLLVSFGRSGGSPESVAVVELAEQLLTECHQLVVTCNEEGALYRVLPWTAQCAGDSVATRDARQEFRDDVELHGHAARGVARVSRRWSFRAHDRQVSRVRAGRARSAQRGFQATGRRSLLARGLSRQQRRSRGWRARRR